jgi:hypothetical protein
VRQFLLAKWQERAQEIAPDKTPPTDLTDSCKFSALFGSVVFSADIAGNWDHVFNVIDGEIFDINAEASDVAGRADIHRHDSDFINGDDFADSIQTCLRRVSDWVNEFSERYPQMLDASVTPSI